MVRHRRSRRGGFGGGLGLGLGRALSLKSLMFMGAGAILAPKFLNINPELGGAVGGFIGGGPVGGVIGYLAGAPIANAASGVLGSMSGNTTSTPYNY